MKKILFLVVVLAMMAVLIQCVSAPQRWPAYEEGLRIECLCFNRGLATGWHRVKSPERGSESPGKT